MSIYEAFMWLLFAHFIGDWALQPRWIGENKGNYKELMFAHCMIYTACCAVALKFIGIGNIIVWSIWILISHYLVDYWKCRVSFGQKFPTIYLYIDHTVHFGVLISILIFQTNENLFI